jgi:hypothetical protein
MISCPELEVRRRHDLRLHTANVAANRNQIFRRLIEEMMTAQAEGVNLFRSEGNLARSFG